MKNLLIVSYDFPPSSVGIWRTLKYCRYMGEFGWRPYVLTVKEVRSPRYDWRPMKELPEGTEVRRTESLDQNRLAYLAGALKERLRGRPAPASQGISAARNTNATARRVLDTARAWLMMPDDRMGWMPFAIVGGKRWLREQRFDAIYSTCYPHTAHVVGERLAAASGLPYMADFRDIWIGSYVFYKPATRWHDRLQRHLERWVVERAACVVSATRQITEDFLERYPDVAPEKFATITNGFDAEDFSAAKVVPDREHFTITYAGTMYGETSPAGFFKGVAQVLAERPEWRRVLRLRFIGSMIEPYRAMIGANGLTDVTQVENYLAHDEALRVMAEADALLLIVADRPGSHIMLTQKVFEYAAARRPVLGLVPKGAARDFLEEIKEGPIVHPDDAAGVADALRGMLQQWQERGRIELGENPALAKYQRRELTRELCAHLDAMCHGRR